MNHLRDLLERLADNHDVYAPGVATLDAMRDQFDLIATIGEQAVCFWMGEYENLKDLAIIPGLCRLPFETCWFECETTVDGKSVYVGALLTSKNGVIVDGSVWCKFNGMWGLLAAVTSDQFDSERVKIHGEHDEAISGAVLAVGAVRSFLSALHC